MCEFDFALLGGVTVRAGPAATPVRLSRQRERLLGRLLLEPGAHVTTDALVEVLWEGEERLRPRNGLQQAVRSLRALLGDTISPFRVVVHDRGGYRLVVDPARIDAVRFARLAAAAHELVAQRPLAARAMLTEALASWGGRLLGEHAERAWAAGHAAELDSVRDGAQRDLNEARLALGEHAELERSLRRQIALHPQDERLRGQLVRALDGAGRTAEAMLAYRQAVRDLGRPGPQLQRIGAAVGRPAPPPVAATAIGWPAPPPASQPAGVLLCAIFERSGRLPPDPGIGTATLIVDEHGGDPWPLRDDRLIARFAEPGAALQAASVMASHERMRAAIAVHGGGVVAGADGPGGPGPARCWQLAAAAHPGQVLVSEAARARAMATGAEIALHALGTPRFADLRTREPVFELSVPGRAARFPPLASLDRLRHNLPVQHTGFVGRRRALGELSRLAGGGALVTLTGPGGSGKTRLALQLAAEHASAFADGVWFVALAELAAGAGPEAVAAAVAGELGARPLPAETIVDALTRHLSDRAALLVLDNCEHVHAACRELSVRLRAACPQLCVLSTSRRPLRAEGERVWPVPPLALASVAGAGAAAPSEAAELLLERAGPLLAEAPADAVACCERICRALDGLPLAIELAAGLIATRGLAAVAEEVKAAMSGAAPTAVLAALDASGPERQRTLDAAIGWSYRLLRGDEQLVLRRLAVFRGGFGAPEAQAVTGGGALAATAIGPILTTLLETSMVAPAAAHEVSGRTRLIEPVRAFALGRLERDSDVMLVRARHAAAYAALAARAAPALFGPDEQASLERLEAEHDNLRAALAWSVERGDSAAALKLVGALWWLWFSHGHLEEGGRWVSSALAIDDEPSRARVRALRAGSHLAWWRGDFAQSAEYSVALRGCAEAIGDDWGRAWAPMGLGAVELFRDPRDALALFEDSRRRFDALGRSWEAGYALQLIGGARWFAGDERAASAAFEEAVEIFERAGHRSVLASVRRSAGLMAARCGQSGRGVALCRGALALSDVIGDRAGSAQALNYLASIGREEGDLQTALARHAEALALAREVGELWATCWALDGIAGAARAAGEPELAARLLAHSGRLAARAGYRQPPREQELRTSDVAALRADLDRHEFERASAEGELMSVGEAVSCALAFAAR